MDLQIIDLVKIHDSAAWTNSLIVADRFGKRHDDVLKSIRNLECSEEFYQRNFKTASYLNEQSKSQPMYELTRDGAMFLIMGFTGAEAARWKEAFIEAFNEAEKHLTHRCPSVEELAEEFISLNPYWKEIRDLTLAGMTIDQIAETLPAKSRSAIGRARVRMSDLGLMGDAPLYRRRELIRIFSQPKTLC